MNFKHTTCYWCIHKDTVWCPLTYIEEGVLEVDPTIFYCERAEDDLGYKQRPV